MNLSKGNSLSLRGNANFLPKKPTNIIGKYGNIREIHYPIFVQINIKIVRAKRIISKMVKFLDVSLFKLISLYKLTD